MDLESTLRNFTVPNIKPIVPFEVKNAEANYASEFCKRILDSINKFDESLDSSKQVGIRLVSFGQSITFAVSSIGYSNPSLIYFYGVLDNGSPVQLVQHVSQISFLLMAVNKVAPEEPKKPIGFRVANE